MAKDDLYIPHNSFLNCDKGAVPMQLVATPKKHNLYGLPIATESDNVPLVNIPCFGVCSVNNSPCIPIAPEWKGVHNGAQKVLGKAPLLSTSYCKCQKGGSIKIFLTKKDAEAALANDKKSRVDGIPWLDGAIGNALLGPVGIVANKFLGSDDISEGLGRGFRKGLKGTLNFFTDDIWKADTWKGMGKMAGVAIVGYGGPIVLPMTPEKRLKAFDETFGTDLNQTHDAIGSAITQTWDEKVVNGTNAERSELAGQTAEMVFEAVLGSKGAGLVTKGTMAGAKMALGAERFTEITTAFAKLRGAVKLESLLNKVKGIFKVGSKEIFVMRENETLGAFGERVIQTQLEKQGFDRFYRVQNKSGNGVDIIARNSKTGAMKKIEVKSTQQESLWANGAKKEIPLKGDQKTMGGEKYTNDRLDRAAGKKDGYTDEVSPKEAKAAQKALEDAKDTGRPIDIEKHDVYVDKDGNLLGQEKRDWPAKP